LNANTKHESLSRAQLLQTYVDCNLMFVYFSLVLNYENSILEEGRRVIRVEEEEEGMLLRLKVGGRKGLHIHKL
jgi:hypothetical protein